MDSDDVNCPSCAEKIKRAARVCRFCGRDVAATPEARPNKGSGGGIMLGIKIFIGMFIALVFLVFVGGVISGFVDYKRAVQNPPQPSRAKLEVEKQYEQFVQGDYIYIRGSVKNVGEVPLRYFKVVVEFKNAKGEVVDTTYTNSTERINPGSRKKFEIMHRRSPEISGASLYPDELVEAQ